MNEINVSRCPHFLLQEGAFKNHEYINNANGCSLRSLGSCVYNVCDSKCEWYELQQLKAENEKLKDTIKEMEDDLDDWVSDVSILYTYDDRKPNDLDELQYCMEYTHEEWSKYKQCLDEIEKHTVINLCPECCEDNYCSQCYNRFKDSILQLIKQVKESEE